MTAAIIALSIGLAMSIAANAALAWWLRAANDQRMANGDLASKYKDERNSAVIRLAARESRVTELERLLRAASAERDRAVKDSIHKKAEEIRNAKSGGDALDSFRGVLSDPVLPEAGDSGAGGDGSGSGGMPPA